VLVAGAGGVLTLIGVTSLRNQVGGTATGNLMILLAYMLLAGVCLVGLRFASPGLMRAGFVLQLLSTIIAIILSVIMVSVDAGFLSDGSRQLMLAMSLLNLLSLFCLSYALAPAELLDAGMIVLQLAAGIGLMVIFLERNAHFGYEYEHVFEVGATFLCLVLSAAVLAIRFPSWRRQPVVILCLAGANALYAVFYFLEFTVFFPSPSLIYTLILAFESLAVLGFLVLVQTERVKKKAHL
jgi:hypothetical protein